MIINFWWLERSYYMIQFTQIYKLSLINSKLCTAHLVHQQNCYPTQENQFRFLRQTMTPHCKSKFTPFRKPSGTVLSNLTEDSTPGAVHCTVHKSPWGTWPQVFFLTIQIIPIIGNPPSLAMPLTPVICASSWRGFPHMLWMASALGGLYVEPPCPFVFWYLECYVWLSSW